jgi:hypothetical protein
MGLFLARFYQDKPIAANDIGAINYLADIRTVDLVGLGTLEVASMKRRGNYNTQQIYELAKQKGVSIAIVYDSWYNKLGGLPPQWIIVGEWKIFNNVVCGSDTVSFYAVDPLEIDNLIKKFKAFSNTLPAEVVVKITARGSVPNPCAAEPSPLRRSAECNR